MTPNTPPKKKGIDLPTHADYIGQDEENRDHYFSGYENTIYVLRNGTRVHVRTFEGVNGLDQWVSQVGEQYGWDELRYTDGGIGDILTDKLEEAIES